MPSSVYLHDGEKQITVRFPTEEDRERFKAHYRALDALAMQFRAERDQLRGEVARSVIERRIIDLVVRMRRADEAKNASYWCALDNDLNDAVSKYLALEAPPAAQKGGE